ncbi:hypothetical protein D3C77_595040 [compost metagenome]
MPVLPRTGDAAGQVDRIAGVEGATYAEGIGNYRSEARRQRRATEPDIWRAVDIAIVADNQRQVDIGTRRDTTGVCKT